MDNESGDAFRLGIRQGAQQKGIHYAENGSVDTDAERQRHQRNRGKQRSLRQSPERVFQRPHSEILRYSGSLGSYNSWCRRKPFTLVPAHLAANGLRESPRPVEDQTHEEA